MPRTSRSKAIIDVDAELAAEVKRMGQRIALPGSAIRISRSGLHFEIPGAGLTEAPIDVVIVDFTIQHHLYATPYDADNIEPPICFAINQSLGKLTPSSNAPAAQAKTCGACPFNQFGSAGPKRKACKNSRLLAVLPPDAEADTPLSTMRVSPAGLKSFDRYVTELQRRLEKAPIHVLTQVDIVEAGQGYTMDFGNPRPNPAYKAMFERREEAKRLLEAEPEYPTVVPMPAPYVPTTAR